jgi:hypothetical protein
MFHLSNNYIIPTVEVNHHSSTNYFSNFVETDNTKYLSHHMLPPSSHEIKQNSIYDCNDNEDSDVYNTSSTDSQGALTINTEVSSIPFNYESSEPDYVHVSSPENIASLHKLDEKYRLLLQYNVAHRRIFITQYDEASRKLFEFSTYNPMPLDLILGSASSPRAISKIYNCFENNEYSSFYVNLYTITKLPVSAYMTLTPLQISGNTSQHSGHESALRCIATIIPASAIGNARFFASTAVNTK